MSDQPLMNRHLKPITSNTIGLENTNAESPERICPSCHKPGSGTFCTHCSEVMDPRRITMKSMVTSVPDVFFDVEHGLFFTIKTMIMKPGETIRRYFNGDRQKHYKPLKFILFIGGLMAFLFVSFNIHANYTGGDVFRTSIYTNAKINERLLVQFTIQWTSVIMLIQFPLIALASWLVFRKPKYFFGEHLTANAYFIGEVLIYHILLFPVYYLANGTQWITVLYNFYSLWIVAYYTYAFYDWIYSGKTTGGFFKSLLFVICTFIFISLLTVDISEVLYILKMKLWGS